jgi:hypothetical protein
MQKLRLKYKQLKTLLGMTCSLFVGLSIVNTQINQAVQLSDGLVYFIEPPNLISAKTSTNSVNYLQPTYYFTINIPENAGESLQKVVINQQEGVDNIISDIADTYAFLGVHDQKKARLTLAAITKEAKKRTVSITFNPPVSPGQKVTIALIPVSNPRISGVYMFGVNKS